MPIADGNTNMQLIAHLVVFAPNISMQTQNIFPFCLGINLVDSDRYIHLVEAPNNLGGSLLQDKNPQPEKWW